MKFNKLDSKVKSIMKLKDLDTKAIGVVKFKHLDTRAQLIARRYKACEKELLLIISELDQKKAFRYWGYNSLFAYVTQGL